MNSSKSSIPQLRWVLVEGNLCEVSEFRDLARKDRPEAYCPVCEKLVTLKLGQKRVPHFAHRPEDTCAVNSPETALHLNCKFHIYRQLQSANELYLAVPCQHCHSARNVLWKSQWDKVEVEYKMGSLRPDIALLQQGKVIGAIEILVTHAVDEAKANQLASLNVDWIELRGYEKLYEQPNAWTADQALDPDRQHPDAPAWVCDSCQKRIERQKYAENNRIEILYAKMIDLYFKSGKKYREVFYVKQAVSYGKTTRLWIENEKRERIAEERAPITDVSKINLNNAFKLRVNEFQKKAVVVDSEMEWVAWIPGQKFVPWDIDNYPYHYLWHETTREWILQIYFSPKWPKLP